MRAEDLVQLYHYQPLGIRAYVSSMTYQGIKISSMWKMEVKKNGIHFRAETPVEETIRLEEEHDHLRAIALQP
jgi:hypothetical protein